MEHALSEEHIAAVDRHRRTVVNYDAIETMPDPFGEEDIGAFVKARLFFPDDPDIRIDSIWWNWGEGNVAPYRSKVVPSYQHPGYKRWLERGIDIVRVFLEATHERGIEAFFSHRMNGGDNDPMYVPGVGTIMDGVVQGGGEIGDAPSVNRVPLKEEHPDWLFHTSWSTNGWWNYAVEGVRDHLLTRLLEVAEGYDFDGIQLDFARGFPFPAGQGWPNRDKLTDLVRQLRRALLDIGTKRGRPFLLTARVAEDLPGCHFDGLDVETWSSEHLVDMFVLGCRSFEVDVAGFRRTTQGKNIKLYPSLDDGHASDGYCNPPVEVLRGVLSNWNRQGADGVQTFNWGYGPREGQPWWELHQRAYREMSDPPGLRYLDKNFVVQRRGGGHGPALTPRDIAQPPENWSTPRDMYANSNMLSQLPAPLDPDGKADTLLTLYVGDDIGAEADKTESVSVWVLLHDRLGGDYPLAHRNSKPPLADSDRIPRALIRDWFIPQRLDKNNPIFLYNSPPLSGIERRFELRVNNVPLQAAHVKEGWVVFEAWPDVFAVGDNLLGLRVAGQTQGPLKQLSIEKLELRVKYS